MGDTIVVEGDDITYLIESDGNTDPVAQRALFLVLEDYSQSQGFNVDILDPQTSALAATDGFVAGGGQGTALDGVEEVIRALNSNADVFSPDGFSFTDVLGPLVDYEGTERKRAASAAASSSAAAAQKRKEQLARERDDVLRRLTRAEEDRRIEVQRQQDSRDIALQTDRDARTRASLNSRLSLIAQNNGINEQQFAISLENLGLTRTGFERDTSLGSEGARNTASSLGATGSPVQAFQERLRELSLADDRGRLDNQAESLDLQRQAQRLQESRQLDEAQRALEAQTAEENARLLDFINNRNNAATDLTNERNLEDVQTAYNQAIGGQTINNQVAANPYLTAQENTALLDYINGLGSSSGGSTTTTTTEPPPPNTSFNDAVSNPGTIDDVVDTVVSSSGGGSAGLFA